MTLVLTADQDRSMVIGRRFMEDPEARLYILTGYAGTGKTTLINLFKEFGTPTIGTPTGKSSLRVSEVTGLKAKTIHRIIYKPVDNPKTGEPTFVLRPFNDIAEEIDNYLLIDEASMIDEKLWKDLWSVISLCDLKVILVGDPFQLPPVSKTKPGEKPFSVLDLETPYRSHMTEIVRQASESPIIQASMMIREGRDEGKALRLLNPIGESAIISKATELNDAGNAVLVHRNVTRQKVNHEVRKFKGLPLGQITPNEPLMVLKNNYRIDRYNGEVVRFKEWDKVPTDETVQYVRDSARNSALPIQYGLAKIHDIPESCILATTEISGHADKNNIGDWVIGKAAKQMFRTDHRYFSDPAPYVSANFAYGASVHKAQGSEWPEVLLLIENSLNVMSHLERRRWLYTGVTRGSSKVYYVFV